MITLHLYYTGENGTARAFAEEMTRRGVVEAIRAEDGNLRYAYYFPMEDPETVLLIDQWRDQAAIDAHHASPMMGEIAALREKYDLHMTVERFVTDDDDLPEQDLKFIKR
jgi:quinol monooxygenase YgiN